MASTLIEETTTQGTPTDTTVVVHPCGMERSTTIGRLASALVQFQGSVAAVPKDAYNPHFKQHYASLDSVLKTIRQPLESAGLAVTQLPCGAHLVTMLLHTSGEYLLSAYSLTPKDQSPQGMGTAITYARRYALGAILGLAPDEDDDGEGGPDETGAGWVGLSKRPTPNMTQPTKSAKQQALIQEFWTECVAREFLKDAVRRWIKRDYQCSVEDMTEKDLSGAIQRITTGALSPAIVRFLKTGEGAKDQGA